MTAIIDFRTKGTLAEGKGCTKCDESPSQVVTLRISKWPVKRCNNFGFDPSAMSLLRRW